MIGLVWLGGYCVGAVVIVEAVAVALVYWLAAILVRDR